MDVHVYFHDSAAVLGRLDAIDSRLTALFKQGAKTMATLQDIQDSEAHEGTAIGQLADAVTQLKAGVATLQQQLADALAGTTLPPAVQAAVDAAFATSKANSDGVDAILTSLAPTPAGAPTTATP